VIWRQKAKRKGASSQRDKTIQWDVEAWRKVPLEVWHVLRRWDLLQGAFTLPLDLFRLLQSIWVHLLLVSFDLLLLLLVRTSMLLLPGHLLQICTCRRDSEGINQNHDPSGWCAASA